MVKSFLVRAMSAELEVRALPSVAVYRIVNQQKSASDDGRLAGEKTMVRFCRGLASIAFAALAFGAAMAQAQTAYPNRPVKIIVPIGPGGSYDLVGRYVADVLSKRLGQGFFVENKPGA